MSIPISRSRLAWVAAVTFSTIVAIVLTIKIVLFDPNWPYKPACLGNGLDYVVLDGTLTDVFRNAVASPSLASWMPHGYRVDADGVYVSLIDFNRDAFLNYTIMTIQFIHETELNTLVKIENYVALKKSRGEFPPRPLEIGILDCELTAAIAIR